MKPGRRVAIFMAMLFLGSMRGSLPAEDWTMLDGKVYHDVKVVKAEPDAVTILHRDGGALIRLLDLPADLQKRFNFDPDQALAAAKALEEERRKLKQLMDGLQAAQIATALRERAAGRGYTVAEPALLRLDLHANGFGLGPSTGSGVSKDDILDPRNYIHGDVMGKPVGTITPAADILDPNNHLNNDLLDPSK
jgi:hypothetical protein